MFVIYPHPESVPGSVQPMNLSKKVYREERRRLEQVFFSYHYDSTPYIRMHGDKNNKKNEERHDCSCTCDGCQLKYGGLPVLLQGIATKESEPTPSTSAGSVRRREMSCPECNKVFNHRGDLNKHLRTHSGEKPFKCPMCEKYFAHTSNLTRHIKVHTGDKPFECDKCGTRFSRKDKLEQHKTSRLCVKKSLKREETEMTD